jgi:2,3-bisphosphoglycerate-independent phosphoglycerate mutase
MIMSNEAKFTTKYSELFGTRLKGPNGETLNELQAAEIMNELVEALESVLHDEQVSISRLQAVLAKAKGE